MSDQPTPMFPLGTVIFPYTAVPLRVFEPRYQTLLDRVLSLDGTFGTVLIERGSEVGGGDSRFEVGSLVKVLSVEERPDGERTILVAANRRIEVTEWLPDDPYPQARVREWPDVDEPVGRLVAEARARLRTVMALASELGADVSGFKLEVADDPVAASYQVAALSPLTALDAYRLLVQPGPASRLSLLTELLESQIEIIKAQLGSA